MVGDVCTDLPAKGLSVEGEVENPAPGISGFLVQIYGEQRDALMAYAIERGHGVDISEFISVGVLDDPVRCGELVRWYGDRLPEVRGPVVLHGALWSMAPSARDPKVRAATKERMTQCLEIAEELGLSRVVFHLDFNALAHDPTYPTRWAERQGAFWRELLAGRKVTVFLENVWEPRPEVVRMAVEAVGLEAVGACLDVAHTHLNSQLRPSEWVEGLATHLRCLHVSDNDRSRSQHLPPGQGTIDWVDLLSALARHGLSLPTVIEVGGVEGARATEEYLSGLEIGRG